MASFLSLVAGVAIGLAAGWLLRGSRAGAQPATETVAEPATVEPAAAEPAAVEPAAAEPAAADRVAAPEPDPVAQVEPAAQPEPVTNPEPIAGPEPERAPEPVAVAAPAHPEPAAAVPAAVPAAVLAPVAVPMAVAEPDDLTRIAGIGPKMAMALAAGGITSYRQLAESDVTALRAVITAAGMRSAPSLATWPERAKHLAADAN